jgi:hypothetical protein
MPSRCDQRLSLGPRWRRGKQRRRRRRRQRQRAPRHRFRSNRPASPPERRGEGRLQYVPLPSTNAPPPLVDRFWTPPKAYEQVRGLAPTLPPVHTAGAGSQSSTEPRAGDARRRDGSTARAIQRSRSSRATAAVRLDVAMPLSASAPRPPWRRALEGAVDPAKAPMLAASGVVLTSARLRRVAARVRARISPPCFRLAMGGVGNRGARRSEQERGSLSGGDLASAARAHAWSTIRGRPGRHIDEQDLVRRPDEAEGVSAGWAMPSTPWAAGPTSRRRPPAAITKEATPLAARP